MGRVGYPPPGSQLCPAHGSAQSEPGCWTGLMTHPGTLLPGIGFVTVFCGSRPSSSRSPWEGGGGLLPSPPVPYRDDSDGMSEATCHNLGSALQPFCPYPLPILICRSRPCFHPRICYHQHSYRLVTWLTIHACRIQRIHHEANPV